MKSEAWLDARVRSFCDRRRDSGLTTAHVKGPPARPQRQDEPPG
jgi:hypothetical protein